MSFYESSRNVELIDDRILQAELKDVDGNWVQSMINLDDIIGNIDGEFVWNGENFTHTANNIHLDGSVLTADLENNNGDFGSAQAIDLNEFIANINGELDFVG
ncbi:hypothetical protein NW768_008588 [Fusarium equiseti]|uniref:Cyanovirin-N domain-containing protein n=1 Tax=Fusarium equiseti TaxID=61235 RepID=A0ABQ8R4Z5_FUSEQ|nr:hypothetical protein NW768_008588 [Fusarium equiseti]